MAIKLIVGLQNPGATYQGTRHNAGGWFVETLAHRHQAAFKLEKGLHAALASFDLDNKPCKAILPSTYMNQSGMATRAVSQFYKIQPDEILVVHDELDLPCGRIKLKTGGGNGGHNGLRDIIAQLGSSAFHRLRIGIGHPGHKDLVLNYVLGKPRTEEREEINEAIDRGIEVMSLVLSDNIMNAMNILNK
jgi:PTH1 family peptidyl-tRNA hydrolase